MREPTKFEQGRRNGLLTKSFRVGRKWLTTQVVGGAIARAMRRGRISKETARRCMDDWPDLLNSRPQSLKWSQYASAQLLEVARYRRRGRLWEARHVLQDVRQALAARQASKKP